MARWLGWDLSVAGPFIAGASLVPLCFRFHTPLIEPDVRICRIRFSGNTHAVAEAIACDAVCNLGKYTRELSGLSPISLSYRRFLRSPSTEAPSLHRNYSALSLLRASPPSQSARSVSRELPVDPYCDHRWDFPCCVWPPLPACRRQYPGRSDETYSLIPFHQLRPSPLSGRVGSCINGFEACSAFTHVTACTLAKSPSDPLHQRLQQFRCLHYCSDCYRVERTSSRAGLFPLWTTAFSRRTR